MAAIEIMSPLDHDVAAVPDDETIQSVSLMTRLSQPPSSQETPRTRHSMPSPLPTIPSESETSSPMSSASSADEPAETYSPAASADFAASCSPDDAETVKGTLDGTLDGTAVLPHNQGSGQGKKRGWTVTGVPPVVDSEPKEHGVRRLSVQGIQELSEPESLPIGLAPPLGPDITQEGSPVMTGMMGTTIAASAVNGPQTCDLSLSLIHI